MMLTRVLDKTALLDYSLMTVPYPLYVGAATGPATLATLTFVVSAPREIGTVAVQRLIFTLPIGGDPTDLAEDAGGMTASVASSGSDRWQAGPGAAAGAFVVRPTSDAPIDIAEQALTITFHNVPVSRLVGTARVTIVEEHSAPTPQGTLSIEVPKFPPGFYAINFTATVPLVAPGQPVTLKWAASSNARCQLSWSGGKEPVDVSNQRTWTSPPLYTTAVFVLHATVAEGGQTVSLDQSTSVVVAAPEVVSFDANPDQVDYGGTAVVTWRSTYADGVELQRGQSRRVEHPPNSDDSDPTHVQLLLGDSYNLQAFKKQGSTRIRSRPFPLVFSFNPVAIPTFKADPKVVDPEHQSTTLTWEVVQAKTVTLDGKEVSNVGSKTETPTRDTPYILRGVGEDDVVVEKQVTVTTAKVAIHDATTRLEGRTLELTFDVANAVRGDVEGRAYWLLPHTPRGPDQETAQFVGYVFKKNGTRWEGSCSIPGGSINGSRLTSVSISWSFRGIDAADVAKGSKEIRP